jgi:hypothetical protein
MQLFLLMMILKMHMNVNYEVHIRGVHELGKLIKSGQTHPIQLKKAGWIGLLSGYGFQNEKIIEKIGFRAKSKPETSIDPLNQ